MVSSEKVHGARDCSTIEHFIWGEIRNGVRGVVDGASDVGEEVEPIVLIEVNVTPHDLLNGAIGDLGLAVKTLVVCIRE